MSNSSNSNAPPTYSLSSSASQQQLASSSSNGATTSSNSQNNVTTTTATDPNSDSEQVLLQNAGKVIDDRLARDEQWVGIGDRLGFGASYDYIPPPNSAWAPFSKRRTVSLPDRLFDEYTSTAHCTMGLLPEIERAWVTIDNRLLLWDWADGSSFSTFDELKQVILGVGLVRPRPGVFVDSISYILVIATASQITLVGLGYTTSSSTTKPEITFYLTGLTVPSDGLPFTRIRGTSTGRIFLSTSPDAVLPGGREGDGCLYELAYQSSEGWFVKRCTLHNLTSGSITQSLVPAFLRSFSAIPSKDWIISFEVDSERGVLYTLLRNSVIEMYELPSSSPNARFDGPPNKVAKTGDVLRAARDVCKSPALEGTGFRIVSLEVISMKESEKDKVGLVAITNTGVRLYFTHQRRYPSYTHSIRALELFHVRPPPVNQQQNQPPPPPPQQNTFYGGQQQMQAVSLPVASNVSTEFAFKSVIQAKYASGGLLVAANNRSEEVGVLFLAAPDNAAASQQALGGGGVSTTNGSSSTVAIPGSSTGNVNQQRFSELAGTIEIGGQTWDMAEITPLSIIGPPLGRTGLNELATQINQPRREWVILTDMGANVISRQRPVDTLLDLLESTGLNGGNNHEIGIFFNAYGLNQSCAMLIAIAAGNSKLASSDSSPTAAATSTNQSFTASSRTPASAVEHAKSLFFEHGGRPVAVDRGGFSSTSNGSTNGTGGQVIFSGKHEGLAFYLSRLLRPIWSSKLTRLAPIPGNPNRQTTHVAASTLTHVQKDLVALRSFIESEQRLFVLPTDVNRAPHLSFAYQTEQRSLNALKNLLIQSVEAISFVLLLIDYQIGDLIDMCDQEVQKKMLEMSWMDLLTRKEGREVARKLVAAVINQQIGRQLSVDAISDTLQQRCGSFCSADDVLLYKAIEAIRRAKDTNDNNERNDSLRESLRLFIKASKQLSFERAREVCNEYVNLRYFLGAIDLALACAHEWDSTNRAVSYWLDGTPSNDNRSSIYELRKKCNELVFSALQRTDDLLNEASNPSRHDSLSYAEADSLRSNAYSKALSIKDELFHSDMYDWYLSRGMTDQILETRTPYLEAYLSREPTTLEKSDLLWQYYARTSRFSDAAHVLAILAETSAFPLSIFKRVEYLSLAVGNAKSQFPSNQGQAVQFLTDVEEKLEVAQVQIEIYRAIEGLEFGGDQEEKQVWLDHVEDRLFTISELYSQFAEPLELLEIILLIFHVSDHRDPYLVAATWEAIVARAREEVPDPDQTVDLLSVKIAEMGRRFHSSEVAFPLPALATLFEKFGYEAKLISRAGWVPLALHEAGVRFQVIFSTYDELLTAKIPPWHTNQGLVFLATSATVLLEAWLQETTTTGSAYPSSSISNPSLTSESLHFPAADVTTAVGKWLMAIGSGGSTTHAKDVTARLNEVQREIRRRF